MALVVFSDVHGNLPALELMLEHAGHADGYVCLGDVVGYGPWSNECVDLVTALPNLVYLEGNHEADFVRGRYAGRNPVAQQFFDVCHPRFTRFEEISTLDTSHHRNGFTFAHTIDGRYIFPDTPIGLDGNYVLGHTHRQFSVRRPPFWLHNPGSVGQNRRYIDVVDYMTLEAETMTFSPRSFTYDVDLVVNEMRSRDYPASCVGYYAGKPRRG
ncbi:metallophosphoesterase family protein [Jiangella muralis]|uniref:metallophosphoesterase family protein n=1 Tax=Jiangella muralis TaxID=702383 RepID=UPI00069CCE25|nr:metallophosphoesterase [Jiangella muralis]